MTQIVAAGVPQDNARDPQVAERQIALRPMWRLRRALVLIGLTAALAAPDLFPVSREFIACILLFGVLSEVEILIAPRCADETELGTRLLWSRVAYVAIFTVASPGFPAQWMYPTIVALQLIASPGQVGGRGLSFLMAATSAA